MPGRTSWAALAVVSTVVLPIDGDDRALALRGQLAGLERERLVGPGDGTADADGISHEGLLSMPGVVPGREERTAGSQSAIPWQTHRTGGAHVPGERRLTTDTVGPLGLGAQAIAQHAPTGV